MFLFPFSESTNSKLIINNSNYEFILKQKLIRNQLQKIQSDLKKQDNFIFHSKSRKIEGFISDGFVKRSLTFESGIIHFKRRKYKKLNIFNNKYEYFYLLDLQLQQWGKYQHLTKHVTSKITLNQNKKYQDIANSFLNATFSLKTISNIINKQQSLKSNPLLLLLPKIELPNNLIHIMSDFMYNKVLFENKLIELKTLTVFFTSGRKKLSKNRHELLNKRGFHITMPVHQKVDYETVKLQIVNKLRTFYSYSPQLAIYKYSDGAPELKGLKNICSNSFFILDKFHPYRYFKSAFGNKFNKKYWSCINYFKHGKYQELVLFLRTEYETTRKEEIYKAWRYIKNNQEGVLNQSLTENIGCSIEGQIAHLKSIKRGRILTYHNFFSRLNNSFERINSQ